MTKPKTLPSHETLKALLDYDAETGDLIWKERPGQTAFNRQFAGKPTSRNLDRDGYRSVSIHGSVCRAHRVVWKWHHGTDPGDTIDHLNRQRADNRIDNLVSATVGENARNRAFKARGTTPIGNTFQAQIAIAGRTKYIGSFATEKAARAAFLAALQIRDNPNQTPSI